MDVCAFRRQLSDPKLPLVNVRCPGGQQPRCAAWISEANVHYILSWHVQSHLHITLDLHGDEAGCRQ